LFKAKEGIMSRKPVTVLGLATLVAVILIVAMVSFAQSGADKPYKEGLGAERTGSYEAPGAAERDPEGLAGKSGRLEGANSEQKARVEGGAAQIVIYRFSGVTDDGLQGAAGRKEATSIHCTNLDSSQDAELEVQVYQYNATAVYTASVDIPFNQTFTFSTQLTSIYFDDVIIGGSPGTPAIFQGSGRILSSHPNVICSAQVIDPDNNPPKFATSLELFRN